jgi:hypothetical protein
MVGMQKALFIIFITTQPFEIVLAPKQCPKMIDKGGKKAAHRLEGRFFIYFCHE